MQTIKKIFVFTAICGIAMFFACSEEKEETGGKVTGLKIVIPPGSSTNVTVGNVLVINGVTYTPANAAFKGVAIESSNTDVVTVAPRFTSTGEQGTGWSATAVSAGTADIIVTLNDDSSVTASLTITVTEPPK